MMARAAAAFRLRNATSSFLCISSADARRCRTLDRFQPVGEHHQHGFADDGEHRVAAHANNPAMQIDVEVADVGAAVVLGIGLLHQRGQLRKILCRTDAGHTLCGVGLDQQTHLEQILEACVAAAEQVGDGIRDGPLVILDDEDPTLGAFFHLQQPAQFKRADGFPDDDAAHAELRSKLTLRRQPLAGLHRSGEDALADPVGNLLVGLATAERLKTHVPSAKAFRAGV